jgi:hypothetical protein
LDCAYNQLTSLDVSEDTSLCILACSYNQLTSLDVSDNTSLCILSCPYNKLTSLDVSSNISLSSLYCGGNQLIKLDLSKNRHLSGNGSGNWRCNNLDFIFPNCLSLENMPSLGEVRVGNYWAENGWLFYLNTTGSPNVYFKDVEGPKLYVLDTTVYDNSIEVISSEDGIIYLLPEGIDKNLHSICEMCIDSVAAYSGIRVNISLSHLEDNEYWLYARDSSGNLSEAGIFTLSVGLKNTLINQLKIYPNPLDNLINIEAADRGQRSIVITSLNGQQIVSKELEGTFHQLDLSSFQKGIYFITVRSADFVTTRKIVKL